MVKNSFLEKLEGIFKEEYNQLCRYLDDYSIETIADVIDEVLQSEDSIEFDVGYVLGMKRMLNEIQKLLKEV